MPDQERWALQTASILADWFRQARFARAAELARSRRYGEATAVLSPNGKLPNDPKELDLLARIAAHQKRFDQAGRLWEIALRRSPGNEVYKQAIQRVARAKRDRRLRRLILINLAPALGAIALILALLFFGPWRPSAPKTQARSPQPVTIHSSDPQSAPAQPSLSPTKR
ncbi:MAG: hypothetical protein JO069_06400 [Verrucomicrobia bacterium]|nr:hypothetical protein [Verrucomicrobiota bacterium]